MGIGSQIRKFRLKAGWTLERLSEVSGVEPGTIHALENRDSSRSKYFTALARAFGMSVEQLADPKLEPDFVIVGRDGSRTIVEVKEPQQPYMWPFKDLKPYQWALLTPEEQRHIENGALILIKARDDPKQPTPATNSASA